MQITIPWTARILQEFCLMEGTWARADIDCLPRPCCLPQDHFDWAGSRNRRTIIPWTRKTSSFKCRKQHEMKSHLERLPEHSQYLQQMKTHLVPLLHMNKDSLQQVRWNAKTKSDIQSLSSHCPSGYPAFSDKSCIEKWLVSTDVYLDLCSLVHSQTHPLPHTLGHQKDLYSWKIFLRLETWVIHPQIASKALPIALKWFKMLWQ